MLTQASLVTLGIFIAGLVYHAGGLATRVAMLEKNSEALSGKIDGIFRSIDEIKGMIRGDRE